MPEIHQIDADLVNDKAVVKFRNSESIYVVMTAEKAASDAKCFRAAVSFLAPQSDPKAKDLANWFLKLADAYEAGDIAQNSEATLKSEEKQ